MQKVLIKIAPLGMTTACVIWFCWSQLSESTPLLAKTEANPPRIERKSLNPDISPVSQRDPFLQYQPEAAESEPVETITALPEEPEFNPRSLLPSIRLDATILGANRLAVINSKIIREGEKLVLEVAPDVQVRIARVLADEIVVTIGQETFHVSYSRKTKPVPSPDDDTNAEPGDFEADGGEPPRENETELPPGTPSPEELDAAVANALSAHADTADERQLPDLPETDELTTSASPEDEQCEFEQDLLDTDIHEEVLNNVE